MFNFGDTLNTCVRFGDRIVKYAYLGSTRIYTCCRCAPTAEPDVDFSDVLYVSDMNTSVCDCSNYNTELVLGRISPNWPNPTIDGVIYQQPASNPDNVVQGSLYFGPAGYGSMNLPRRIGEEFTVEAWAYRESNSNWVEELNMLFFGIFVGTGEQVQILSGGHNVGVRNNVWMLNGVETAVSAPLNTWQHVALCGNARKDLSTVGDMTLYIDGVAAITQTYTAIDNGGAFEFTDLRRVTVGIGGGPEISSGVRYAFPGYIDNLRVTAKRRYKTASTSTFTPPTTPLPNSVTPASSSSSSSSVADPYFQNVAFLLHCDANCEKPTLLRDSSPHKRRVYTAGADYLLINTQAANQSPIGVNQSATSDRGVLKLSDTAWSDYSGGPYIQVAAAGNGLASGNNLSVGTGDYTFEFWGKINGGGNVFISTQGIGLGRSWCELRHGQESWAGNAVRTTLWMRHFSPSPYGVMNIWAVDVTGILGTWTHIAISRSGGFIRVFVNGQAQAIGIDSAMNEPFNPFAQQAAASEGAPDSSNLDFTTVNYFTDYGTQAMALFGFAANAFSGYVDEIRYTVGVGRYTSDFTAPTAPYPGLPVT